MEAQAYLDEEVQRVFIEGNPRIFLYVDTGEDVVTLTSSGIKKEGKPFSRTFKSATDAVDAYIAVLRDFNSDWMFRTRAFLWRTKPEIVEIDGEFAVFSRCGFA